MAGVNKYNYATNLLKKKALQPVHTTSNDIWNRGLDINNNNENKLSAAQHNMERNMLDITYTDWNINKWVREQTEVMGIMGIIKSRKWKMADHTNRRTQNG